MACISINDVVLQMDRNESGHDRGLHLVIINPLNGAVELSQVFDTYKGDHKLPSVSTRYIPPGYIIVAACKDDCVTQLSEKDK